MEHLQQRPSDNPGVVSREGRHRLSTLSARHWHRHPRRSLIRATTYLDPSDGFTDRTTPLRCSRSNRGDKRSPVGVPSDGHQVLPRVVIPLDFHSVTGEVHQPKAHVDSVARLLVPAPTVAVRTDVGSLMNQVSTPVTPSTFDEQRLTIG